MGGWLEGSKRENYINSVSWTTRPLKLVKLNYDLNIDWINAMFTLIKRWTGVINEMNDWNLSALN